MISLTFINRIVRSFHSNAPLVPTVFFQNRTAQQLVCVFILAINKQK